MKKQLSKREMREQIQNSIFEMVSSGKAIPIDFQDAQRDKKRQTCRHRPNKQVGKL